MTKRIPLAVAFAALAMACSDPTVPTRTLVTTGPLAAVLTPITTTTPAVPFGRIELCKTSNVAGTFNFTASGPAGTVANAQIVIGAGGGTVCYPTPIYISAIGNAAGAETVVITETANAVPLTNIDIQQYLHPSPTYLPGTHLNDAFSVANRNATIKINSDMSRRVTFVNTAPPPPVCDFITFGRLVWEEGTQKVVISGNAGGNAPGGGILGEFHIEVNGVDHHVSTISTYGPIAAAPLASATYTNSRRVTGTDKHGHAVELRLWDGGEPGKDTDRFWFNVNGTIVGNATTGNLIDQGNMQYHPNCRGPEQE